jgi:hypothetical protein
MVMDSTGHRQHEQAWVDTDCEGRIERLSRGAAELFGVRGISSDESILRFFPTHHKAVKRDIDLALRGWPEQRTAVVSPPSHDPVVVRYRVSLRFMAAQVGLHWVFDILDDAYAPAH